MFIDHFALGMRIPKENMDIGPKGCMEKLLSGLTRYNISGLGLSGGWVEDVYVIVDNGRQPELYAQCLQAHTCQ